MESKNKYIIYCRKSREDEKAQMLSIQSQKEELQELAARNNFNIFSEREESGSAHKTGRQVFSDIMDQIEAGLANSLLVWKLDRLSRNEFDTARVISAIRTGALQEIRTPFEIFKHGDDPLMLYIHFGQADGYSRNLSSNVKRGNRTKLRLGQYPGHAPFGYRNYRRDNIANIEPDESATLVKSIFTWYASGEYSLLQIKNKLNMELKIPSKYGHKFSKSELQKILKNPVYYGVILRMGELFTGSYEPIISKDLYDTVQGVMNNKSRPRGKKTLHAYKMLLRCAECQSVYTGETKHKYYATTNRHAYYTYYSCSKKNGVCTQKPIKESEFELKVANEIEKFNFDKEEWQIAVDLLMLDLDKKRSFQHELTAKHHTQITKIDSKLSVLLELRTGNEISSEEYLTKKNEYINEKKFYDSKIKELTTRNDEKFELVENFAEVIIQAQSILKGDDVTKKRQLVQSISSDFFILDGKVEISFKKPFSFFFKRQELDKPSTVSGLVDDVRNYYIENPFDTPPLFLV